MRLSSMLFLLLNSCSLFQPKSTSFDGKFEFIQSPTTPNTKKACLAIDDVEKLRELLIRCESGK